MAAKHDGNTRRNFLKRAAVLAPLAAAAPVSSFAVPRTSDPEDDLQNSAPKPAHPAEVNYRPTFFTPLEWAFLNAACARLIPADRLGPGAVELGAPQYIDRQMGTNWADGGIWYMDAPFVEAAPEFGYQSALTPKQQYRLGIRAVDDLCQQRFRKSFVGLSPSDQDDVLKGMEEGTFTSPEIPLKTFFTSFLLENTLEGFFGDPMYGGNKNMASWVLIGHPGARADFLDWVSDSKPYPYGPVDIRGERA